MAETITKNRGSDINMDIEKSKERCKELIKEAHAGWIGISNQIAIENVLEELEKHKIALFMVIRNSSVLPKGMVLNKSMKEINKMSYETMKVIINNTIDFDKAKEMFKEGKAEFDKVADINVGE